MYWEVVVDNGNTEARCDYDSKGGALHAFRMAILTDPFSAALLEWNDAGICTKVSYYEKEAK